MAKYKVIIPIGLRPSPARYEISAAELLALYFKSDVEFVARSNQKTPDFLVNGYTWELKSPTGRSKHNIERQMKAGVKQSGNIILDARRSKIHISRIRSELHNQLKHRKAIKRLLLICKDKQIIELKG
jgi:predicted ABC-class ATPase